MTTEQNVEPASACFAPLSVDDLAEVRAFYYDVIDAQTNASGNSAGWVKGIYPSDTMLENALLAGEFFAARDAEGNIAAAAIINTSCNEGYEGAGWGVGCAPGEFIVPHVLATSPAHRHEGWGRAITQYVIKLAREKGMKAVRLDVLSGNTAAEKLYRCEGFYLVGPSWMFYEDTGWTEYLLYELPLNDAQGEGVGAFHPRSRIDQDYSGRIKASTGDGPGSGYTPEMEELAYLITHPDGDPNTNFRRLGFGGSHLG